MPLIKPKYKEAFSKDAPTETKAAKSFAIAYSTKSKARKMANGGPVKEDEDDDSKKTIGQLIGFPGAAPAPTPTPVNKAHGGSVDADEHYDSIADAILAKKRKAKMMAEGGAVEDDTADLDENDEEIQEPTYEDQNEAAQADSEDRVSRIIRKRRDRKGA